MTLYRGPAYDVVARHYAARVARRSGVPLMNHINEGLLVLSWIDASERASAAYCLHPLLQADEDLRANWDSDELRSVDGSAVILAMEYRSVANAYLSSRAISDPEQIRLSPLKDVNDMLVADKVQNFKDFVRFHRQSHPRSVELDQYFANWFTRLGITMEQFELWAARLEAR